MVEGLYRRANCSHVSPYQAEPRELVLKSSGCDIDMGGGVIKNILSLIKESKNSIRDNSFLPLGLLPLGILSLISLRKFCSRPGRRAKW